MRDSDWFSGLMLAVFLVLVSVGWVFTVSTYNTNLQVKEDRELERLMIQAERCETTNCTVVIEYKVRRK